MTPRSNRSGLTAFDVIILVVVIGIFSVVGLGRMPSFLEPQIRSKVSRVKADMRSLATAIEAYAVEQRALPPMGPIDLKKISETRIVKGGLRGMTTYAMPLKAGEADFADPFRHQRGAPFAYFTQGDSWLLVSPGPDGKFDLRPEVVNELKLDERSQPEDRLSSLTYDPTNGVSSVGDIYRLRQVETKKP